MAKREKKTGKPQGFEEQPQAPLSGTPLSGSVSDWASQIADGEDEFDPRELEKELEKKARDEEMRAIRSAAGKHRLKASKGDRKQKPGSENNQEARSGKAATGKQKQEARSGKAATGKQKQEARSGKAATGKPERDLKTARGTSMGGPASPEERAAGGLNPVAGLEISLEEANAMGTTTGATATVEALTKLITDGNPLIKNGEAWVPHRPARPAKSEGGIEIRMATDFEPSGDQPTAIADLVEGITGLSYSEALARLGLDEGTIAKKTEKAGRKTSEILRQAISPRAGEMPDRAEGGNPDNLTVSDTPPLSAAQTSPPHGGRLEGDQTQVLQFKSHVEPHSGDAQDLDHQNNAEQTQVLLGVTGSGKTFTMAKVIEETQRPALILAPNKTLAAQLYGEFKSFFPDNAVEYFVSYYDYYQPEAYVPRSDTYIEKESSVNEQIDRMRHAATRSLLERDDVIIVASVSCIYGIGSVETYTAMTFEMKVGDRLDQRQLLADLVAQQYKRNDMAFVRGSFRVRGDTIEIFPAHLEDAAWRISMWGDEIESITEFDPLTGQKTGDLKSVKIYANSHYVTPRPTLNQAIKSIKSELQHRLAELNDAGRLLEAQRLEQRTQFDLEMLEATGSCAGIENYSRYLTGRKPGEPPPTLFEYIPDNAIVFIDESHVTVPQIGGMYRGDFRRKATLAEYGFRLPSCMDNRPLRFEEWDLMRPQTIAVSATPGGWELEQSGGVFAEQVIRPTGLIDPPVEVRPAKTQVDDVLGEINATTAAGYRTLVTVLTKKMAEDLTEYLHEAGVRVRYMHSDIDTLERIEILRDLRLGAFDVLVGINLLREGLDIPECGFVAILDADKEGFLRSETSLVQTIGRAARNVDGRVVLYADRITGSMERAMAETNRRREKQLEYNEANGITPESVRSNIGDILSSVYEQDHVTPGLGQVGFGEDNGGAMVGNNLAAHIEHLEKEMRDAAADLDFETAARLRDEVKRLRETELAIADDPLARDIGVENTQDSRKRKAQGKPSTVSRANPASPGPATARPDRPDASSASDVPSSPSSSGSTRGSSETSGGASASSLFRKPHLDEMTVGRTEKPLGKKPDRGTQPSEERGASSSSAPAQASAKQTAVNANYDRGTPPSVAGKASEATPNVDRQAERSRETQEAATSEKVSTWSPPRKSYGEEMRKSRSHVDRAASEGSARSGSPKNDRGTNSAYGTPAGAEDGKSPAGRERRATGADAPPPRSEGAADSVSENSARPILRQAQDEGGVGPVKRGKIGIGSYEDPSDQKRPRKRAKKTGRPGR